MCYMQDMLDGLAVQGDMQQSPQPDWAEQPGSHETPAGPEQSDTPRQHDALQARHRLQQQHDHHQRLHRHHHHHRRHLHADTEFGKYYDAGAAAPLRQPSSAPQRTLDG